MIDFTPAQAAPRIASLLVAHESRTLDFKRVSGKMVGKALEAICAFANTEGGILALGVADEKQEKGIARFYGIKENPEALDDLIVKQAVPGATPNLRKTPKTIRGPLIEQIDTAVKTVLDELAQGLTLSCSGFKTKHLYTKPTQSNEQPSLLSEA